MPSQRYARAGRELAPSDVILAALEIRHPDVSTPVRVIADRVERLIETHVYTPVAFRARLVDDVDGRVPSAELAVDNVGRPLMAWIEASQGGRDATVRVMHVLPGADDAGADDGTGAVAWEVTLDVLGVQATQLEVTVRLGYDPLLDRPAVRVRYDPRTAPGLF